MRPLLICALAATLIGCTWVAPKQPRQASLMGRGAATAPQMDSKTAAKSKRASAAKKMGRRHRRKAITPTKIAKSDTVPNVSPSVQSNDKSNTLSNAKSTVAAKPETAQFSQPDTTSNASSNANSSVPAKTDTAQSFQHAETSNLAINPNSTAIAKTEIPQSSQRDEKLDPVIKKAMPLIAAKMENSVSVEIVEMTRAEKTAAGKSIDTICGYVRGKTASGEETGARPFLYLVQENEAYVGGYNMAISPYHNLCRQ
jgi:hypothetical protein